MLQEHDARAAGDRREVRAVADGLRPPAAPTDEARLGCLSLRHVRSAVYHPVCYTSRMTIRLATLVLVSMLAACSKKGGSPPPDEPTPAEPAPATTEAAADDAAGEDGAGDGAAPCKKTGCSGIVCAEEDMVTTCEFKPEYACYQQATCERQSDGKCGWTKTPELDACLASPPAP